MKSKSSFVSLLFPLAFKLSFVISGLVTFIVIALLFWSFKRRKQYLNEKSIKLLECKGAGKFGTVWKANYESKTVAVKIFAIQNKSYWQRELEIFSLPHMKNIDILHFIGVAKKRYTPLSMFWLVTDYHEKGSLNDYLKNNMLNWIELCQITESITRGLLFLHDEIGEDRRYFKPSIAHRNLKSKNILVKSNMSACISDFGLSVICYPGRPLNNQPVQVGSKHYMAPEILDSTIQLDREGFLCADMYACGLILWEMVNRCSVQEGDVPDYKLPFEDEVGRSPSLLQMKDCVVNKKHRPVLRESWREHPGLSDFCYLIEDCWKTQPYSRLTAAGVMGRILECQYGHIFGF